MTNSVNNSLAIFLLSDTARMIEVGYKVDRDGKPAGPFYNFKTFDATIEPGQLVVVPAAVEGERSGMFTVAKVSRVNVEPDFSSPHEFKWIAGRFDPSGYTDNVAKEGEMIDLINQAEKTRQKVELRAKLTEHMDQQTQAALGLLMSPAS